MKKMTTTHPDRIRPEHVIDHIRDALAEHLGVEASVTDRHTITLTNQPDSTYRQVLSITVDVEEQEQRR